MHLDKLEEMLSKLGSNYEPSEENIKECMSAIEDSIRSAFKRRKPSISPSQTGLTERQIWFITNGHTDVYNPDQFKPETRLKMLVSSVAEHLIVMLMREGGVDVKNVQKRLKVKIEEAGMELTGSNDYEIDGVVDCKVTNSDSFKTKFRSAKTLAENDHFGYLGQAYLYAKGSGKYFQGWDVFDANTFKFKHVSAKNIQKELKEAYDEFVSKLHVASLMDHWDDVEPCYELEHTNSGTRLAWQCSRCPWRDTCWPNIEEERRGTVVRHWLKE